MNREYVRYALQNALGRRYDTYLLDIRMRLRAKIPDTDHHCCRISWIPRWYGPAFRTDPKGF